MRACRWREPRERACSRRKPTGYDDPEPENIQRPDALVISATEVSRSATEVAAEAWDRRPTANGRFGEASVRAWHDAALLFNAIAVMLYTDVE
jgi:hypothetical protein